MELITVMSVLGMLLLVGPQSTHDCCLVHLHYTRASLCLT
jgi:hypothetical protein